MWAIMDKEGGCGIAAPQIGISQRVIAIDLPWQEEMPHVQAFPKTVLFNPELRVLSALERAAWRPPQPLQLREHYEMWESCLSVPHRWGRVRRAAAVAIRFWDERAQPHHLHAWGYLAGLLQHEIDHLDGTLYVDRALETCSVAEFQQRYPPAAWRREFGALVWQPAAHPA